MNYNLSLALMKIDKVEYVAELFYGALSVPNKVVKVI